MELDDSLLIELHPDTHITLGYFTPEFCGQYAETVLAMLQASDAPREGYRLAMHSNFRVNPLANPQSYRYVVYLPLLHPLMATERLTHLLRPRLLEAFKQAAAVSQRERPEVGGGEFKTNFHFSVPSEKKRATPSWLSVW
jgi:hypothetical protein